MAGAAACQIRAKWLLPGRPRTAWVCAISPGSSKAGVLIVQKGAVRPLPGPRTNSGSYRPKWPGIVSRVKNSGPFGLGEGIAGGDLLVAVGGSGEVEGLVRADIVEGRSVVFDVFD